MRQLPPRFDLPAATRRKLAEKSARIEAAADQKREAERVYSSSRSTQWFRRVIDALRQLSGPGERCMLCSGSESSDVEHFRPKAIFPLVAMKWKNFLWSCTICNRGKSDRFPPDTEPGERILNPLEENVWTFFFIDQFGNLTPKWRNDLDDFDPRAVITRKLLNLDRQALQESRRLRRQELVRAVEDSLALHQAGQFTTVDLSQRRRDWLAAPFQPDVADYFLNGPGRAVEPFASLASIIENG